MTGQKFLELLMKIRKDIWKAQRGLKPDYTDYNKLRQHLVDAEYAIGDAVALMNTYVDIKKG